MRIFEINKFNGYQCYFMLWCDSGQSIKIIISGTFTPLNSRIYRWMFISMNLRWDSNLSSHVISNHHGMNSFFSQPRAITRRKLDFPSIVKIKRIIRTLRVVTVCESLMILSNSVFTFHYTSLLSFSFLTLCTLCCAA